MTDRSLLGRTDLFTLVRRRVEELRLAAAALEGMAREDAADAFGRGHPLAMSLNRLADMLDAETRGLCPECRTIEVIESVYVIRRRRPSRVAERPAAYLSATRLFPALPEHREISAAGLALNISATRNNDVRE
ncbi:MAG: hypothetical protein AAB368_15785 [bacterium]